MEERPEMNTTTDSDQIGSANCSQYDKRYSNIAITVAVSTASVTFVTCTVVIVFIRMLKKHHFLPQRLILYLTVAVMIRCLSWVLQKIHFDLVNRYNVASETTDRFCSLAGYFTTTSGWFELLAVTILTTNLFLHAVVTRSRGWLELVYVLIIFLLPFVFTWIPFIRGAYGQAGSWCWIRKETNDCQIFVLGVFFRFAIWFVPLFLLLLILVIFYSTVTYIISKRNNTWDGNFNPMIRRLKLKMQKEVRPLIWYPLIYFLLYLIPLASRITDSISSEPFYPLWILSAITLPLQGGFIAVAFTLDTNTVRRLRRQRITGTVRGITQTNLVEDYPTEHQREHPEYGESSSTSSDDSECADKEGQSARRGRYTEFTRPEINTSS